MSGYPGTVSQQMEIIWNVVTTMRDWVCFYISSLLTWCKWWCVVLGHQWWDVILFDLYLCKKVLFHNIALILQIFNLLLSTHFFCFDA